jgi:hypothetical protein
MKPDAVDLSPKLRPSVRPVLTKAGSFALMLDPVGLIHCRPRGPLLSYEELRDLFIALNRIFRTMINAGCSEFAFSSPVFLRRFLCPETS